MGYSNSFQFCQCTHHTSNSLLFLFCFCRFWMPTIVITSSESGSCCSAFTATPTPTRWSSGRSRFASCPGSHSTGSGSNASPAPPSDSRRSHRKSPTSWNCENTCHPSFPAQVFCVVDSATIWTTSGHIERYPQCVHVNRKHHHTQRGEGKPWKLLQLFASFAHSKRNLQISNLWWMPKSVCKGFGPFHEYLLNETIPTVHHNMYSIVKFPFLWIQWLIHVYPNPPYTISSNWR